MTRQNRLLKTKDSFTLVELLVVIGILAILTAAIVIVLNPAELLKQSRDSKRTTDLAAANNALKLLLTQNPDVSLGNASTVYISLADSSSTCGSYSLPSLPNGWQYRCATTATLNKVDGTGWIPVNFSSGAAQLPALPTDPQNDGPSRLYYAYAASNGRWELVSNFESVKYASREAADGGTDPAQYEIGSTMSLLPFASGMVGYWNFDEGSGGTVYDASGRGGDGTWSAAGQYVAGKVGSYAGYFAGGIVATMPNVPAATTNALTVTHWVKVDFSRERIANRGWCSSMGWLSHALYGFGVSNSTGCSAQYWASFGSLSSGQWYFLAGVFDGTKVYAYTNGQLAGESSTSGVNINLNSYPMVLAENAMGGIDDLRIYNRALSAAEIQSIYNATK